MERMLEAGGALHSIQSPTEPCRADLRREKGILVSRCSPGLKRTDGCVPTQPLSLRSGLRHESNEEVLLTLPVLELSAQLNVIAVAVITVVTVANSIECLLYSGRAATLLTGIVLFNAPETLRRGYSSQMHFSDEDGGAQGREEPCWKVTRCKAGAGRPSVVFPAWPRAPARKAADMCGQLPGGWEPLLWPPLPLGLRSLTSALVIWHKSAPQLHECRSHEHL